MDEKPKAIANRLWLLLAVAGVALALVAVLATDTTVVGRASFVVVALGSILVLFATWRQQH